MKLWAFLPSEEGYSLSNMMLFHYSTIPITCNKYNKSSPVFAFVANPVRHSQKHQFKNVKKKKKDSYKNTGDSLEE